MNLTFDRRRGAYQNGCHAGNQRRTAEDGQVSDAQVMQILSDMSVIKTFAVLFHLREMFVKIFMLKSISPELQGT